MAHKDHTEVGRRGGKTEKVEEVIKKYIGSISKREREQIQRELEQQEDEEEECACGGANDHCDGKCSFSYAPFKTLTFKGAKFVFAPTSNQIRYLTQPIQLFARPEPTEETQDVNFEE